MAAKSWDWLQPKIRATRSGGVPDFKYFGEATGTQTFKAGALVYLDASGQVAAVGDAGTQILGIAQKDASGTTSTEIPVQVAYPGDEIIMRCISTAAGSETLASGMIPGSTYAVDIDANGVARADLSTANATTEELLFIEPVKDVNGAATYEGIFVLEGVASGLHKG